MKKSEAEVWADEVDVVAGALAAEVMRLERLSARLRSVAKGTPEHAACVALAETVLCEEPVNFPMESTPLPATYVS